MKTKKPSAIVYGWHRQGEEILYSGVYWEDYLQDEVHVYSLPDAKNILEDFNKYQPDLIISFIDKIHVPQRYKLPHSQLGIAQLYQVTLCQ